MKTKQILKDRRASILGEIEIYSKMSGRYCDMVNELNLIDHLEKAVKTWERNRSRVIDMLKIEKANTPPVGLFGEDLHGEIDAKIRRLS